MPSAYQIDKQDGIYFLTSTIVDWVDLFIRDNYKQIVADSLNYCIKNLGLEVYAYVIMTSHMHMIAGAKHNNLSNIPGRMHRHTSLELINEMKQCRESRIDWVLPIFREAGLKNPRNNNYQVWQQHNHAEEVYSRKFMLSKILYIHNNPVEAGFVSRAEDYLYSSAVDYSGSKRPVNVTLIELHSLFY